MNIKKPRRLAATAAAVGTLAAVVALPAAPANAYVPGTPPCYGASCIGKDPNISLRGTSCVYGYDGSGGAYDVVTIGLAGYGSTSVTLRYSPTCGANWARWNGGTSLDYWVETTDGRKASGFGGNAPNYTTMVNGVMKARVCIYSGFDDTQNCSGWY